VSAPGAWTYYMYMGLLYRETKKEHGTNQFTMCAMVYTLFGLICKSRKFGRTFRYGLRTQVLQASAEI